MTKAMDNTLSQFMIANTTGITLSLNTATLPVTILAITLNNNLGQSFTFNSYDLSGSIDITKVPFYIMIDLSLLTADEFKQISVSSPITYGNEQSVAITTAFFTDSEGFTYLCISPTSNITLQNGDQLTINLTNVEASMNAGSGDLTFGFLGSKASGSEYQNYESFLLTPINPSTNGNRLSENLDISITGGQGSNSAISNLIYISDSTQDITNILTLTLTNTDPNNPLVQTPSTSGTPQFIISFIEVSNSGDGSVNALGTVSDVQNIVINQVNSDNGNYAWQSPQINTQSSAPYWILTPGSNNTALLGPGGSIDIPIGNIVSHTSPGTTALYLTYKNIGGYNDGSMLALIQKSSPVPTIVSFGTDKSSYEFFETVTFNYDVFGSSTWALEIKDPFGSVIYNNPSLSSTQNGQIQVQPLQEVGDMILSKLGTYTAILSSTNAKGNSATNTQTFILQNTNTVTLNSLIIVTDPSFNILSNQSSIDMSWNAPNSVPGEGFTLNLLVTAINNGQSLETPFPISLANTTLSSPTEANVNINLSGSIEALQPFDNTQPFTFALQLIYNGVNTPAFISNFTTTIECPPVYLKPVTYALNVDNSGNILPYASYITAQWYPAKSGENYYLAIGYYDESENYYPLSYYINSNYYNGPSQQCYTLPGEALSQTFLIAGSSIETNVKVSLNVCSDAAGKNIVFSYPMNMLAVTVGDITLNLGQSQIVASEIGDRDEYDIVLGETFFTITWNIPGVLVEGVTLEDLCITAAFSYIDQQESTAFLPLVLSLDESNYESQYPLSSLSETNQMIYMTFSLVPDFEFCDNNPGLAVYLQFLNITLCSAAQNISLSY